SFAYFQSDRENWSVLHEVARVLEDGGHYLLDFLNRGSLQIQAESEREGEHFRALESRRIEKGRVHKKVRILDRVTLEEKLEYEESVRLYSRSEIRDAAEESGLTLVQEWGTYLGDPWEEGKSPRLILLFQRVPR
ncbi:MAG: class I SAM-dependent methyltransferase, partial [Candidatus Krumholzibacteria bacterium]|nr:class I SAM-dependent methyltransferase [Candidatus Krumholzibacteria bacterium]